MWLNSWIRLVCEHTSVGCGAHMLMYLTGVTISTTLVNAGLTTFDKIHGTNPRELEMVRTPHNTHEKHYLTGFIS